MLVHMHPRTLIQVTLQVTKEPTLKLRRGVADTAIVPALANAALLALVDGGLPLERTMTVALGCVGKDGEVVVDPEEKQVIAFESVHAMAYTREGDLLLNESSGVFDMEQWEEVAAELKKACMAAAATVSEDESMSNGVAERTPWLRQALEEKVRDAGAWRESG